MAFSSYMSINRNMHMSFMPELDRIEGCIVKVSIRTISDYDRNPHLVAFLSFMIKGDRGNIEIRDYWLWEDSTCTCWLFVLGQVDVHAKSLKL